MDSRKMDEEIAKIAGADQIDAACRALAITVAIYHNTLTEAGVSDEAATALTLPMVHKMLDVEIED